jgi:hypothetical protein
MALCIGCLRAANFGDPSAIVWLDVSPTVWHVLVAQIAFRMVAEALVWAADKMGLQRFELSERFVDDHPLCNTAFRSLQANNYVNIFGVGGALIYLIFVVFLGPAFVMGICRNFDPNATHVWVTRALVCANATAVINVTNGTLAAMVPGASPM